jgi:CDP-paratose 2-epimerase
VEIAVVTGSGGLIGAQAVRYFSGQFDAVAGIDNDLRAYFFGRDASTEWAVEEHRATLANYRHHDLDIRDRQGIEELFAAYGTDITLVVHTAAQPSHDWAAKEPFTDFDVNAVGTLNLLEATRRHAPGAVFIFTSTNKVYGDTPNRLPLVELDQRWELDPGHEWYEHGIPEDMTLDNSVHSLFGASKVAADVLCQEYGRYFGLKTGTFRGGCLTGPGHSGAQLHGFLAYLMRCTVVGEPYTVFGYRGKQVRDNIHADDLVNAFDAFRRDPRPGEAYNIGGGREANCSMLEAIELCQAIAGRELQWTYTDDNRIGDHIWWISDIRKFNDHFPSFKLQFDIRGILEDIYLNGRERWQAAA